MAKKKSPTPDARAEKHLHEWDPVRQEWREKFSAFAKALDDPNFGRKRSKYNVKKTPYNGRIYDSESEAKRAEELDNDPRVAWWIPQVAIELGLPENKYKVDFVVAMESTEAADLGPVARMGLVRIHAEDVKGKETAKFRRDRKLWAKYGPFPLHIIHVAKNDTFTEIIEPCQ